jgi:hypothetical protein
MRFVRSAAFTSIVMLGLASQSAALHAQDARTHTPIRDVLKVAPAMAMTTLKSRCPQFVRLDANGMTLDGGLLEPADSNTCAFAGMDTLGRADGRRWIVAKYLWRQMGAADSIKRKSFPEATRDTFDVLHVVLFSAPHAGNLWRPEWYTWIEPHMIRGLTPTLAPGPDGSALLGLLYCWNGTGGCWQAFLHRQGGQWFAVESSFLSSLAKAYPGFGFSKGIYVDARTLRGEAGAYREGEGNCCPRNEVRFNVLLRGHSLVLGRHRLVAVPNPQ